MEHLQRGTCQSAAAPASTSSTQNHRQKQEHQAKVGRPGRLVVNLKHTTKVGVRGLNLGRQINIFYKRHQPPGVLYSVRKSTSRCESTSEEVLEVFSR